jgi:hypothetical protein
MKKVRPSTIGRPTDLYERVRLVVFLEAKELDAVRARANEGRISISQFARAAILQAVNEERTKPMKQSYPLRFSYKELGKFGVTIVDPTGVWLSCNDCGKHWSPDLRTGGHLPRGYWKCPQGCNNPE